ncbi:MAG: Sec-independent protein translocase subunit TatA/TatB [Armatimonadota bacterium]
MGSLGFPEIIGILLIVLLLFGARKIPEVMRSLGQGLREFKKATSEATTEIKRAVDDADEDKPPSTQV